MASHTKPVWRKVLEPDELPVGRVKTVACGLLSDGAAPAAAPGGFVQQSPRRGVLRRQRGPRDEY